MKEDEKKDINGGEDELPEYAAENMISIAFGDFAVTVGGDAPLGELEDRLFRIIDRMDGRFCCKSRLHERDVV
jgi:hypothetical protein